MNERVHSKKYGHLTRYQYVQAIIKEIAERLFAIDRDGIAMVMCGKEVFFQDGVR